MRHNVILEGPSFRVRPIVDSDAPFVLKLRSDPELSRFLHATPLSIESQLGWFERYYERPGD